jgi:hypothetical protein
MNFILFNIVLFFVGFLAVLIFSIGLMTCSIPMALLSKTENPPKVLMLPLLGIAVVYQIYFWGFWSAFCVAMTIKFTHKPEVTSNWLYWIAGFMWCISLIGWLAHKEKQSSQSLEDARVIRKGTTLYSFIAIVVFLIFALSPSLMLPPYGWALKPLGLRSHSTEKTGGRSEIDEKTRKSVEGFFTGYEYFSSANKLAFAMPSSKDPLGDFENVRTLLIKSKERLSECDVVLLNRIYNGWGDSLSENLIPAIDLLLAGTQPKGDRSNLARSDALIAEYNGWLETNWNKMLPVLNEKYGFDIRK